MPQKFANAARGFLAAGISNSATTITLSTGKGVLFPVANTDMGVVGGAADWFKLILDDNTNIEIVYVRTHIGGSDTFTNVLRAQEGTTALAFATGTTAGLRVTAGDMAVSLGREVLFADRTYYVATTGSDSNDGLTVGTPFLTMQKAVNVVCGTLDFSVYQTTIKVANGTYAEAVTLGSWVGGRPPKIEGNAATPANAVLSGAGAKITNSSGSGWVIQGFKLSSTNSGAVAASGGGSVLEMWNVDYGQCNASQVTATYGATVSYGSNYTVSGGSTNGAHMYCIGNASIITSGRTVTLSNTPAFAGGWAWADRGGGYFEAFSMVFTGTGATGPRYILGLLSSCFVNGGGASYFPGNAAGTVATGAQYA